jgi:hypothetical protein
MRTLTTALVVTRSAQQRHITYYPFVVRSLYIYRILYCGTYWYADGTHICTRHSAVRVLALAGMRYVLEYLIVVRAVYRHTGTEARPLYTM